MTSDMIEKFVENGSRKNAVVNIHFKERSTVTGVFVKGADYDELNIKISGALFLKPISPSGSKQKI